MTRPRVAPYLTVTPAAAAIGFYTAAFGAKQVALMPSVDGLRGKHPAWAAGVLIDRHFTVRRVASALCGY